MYSTGNKNHDAVLLGTVVTQGFVLEAYYHRGNIYYRALRESDGLEVRFLVDNDRLTPISNQYKEGSAEWYKILYLLERNKHTLLHQNLPTIGKTLILTPIKFLGEQASTVVRDTIKGIKDFKDIYKNL